LGNLRGAYDDVKQHPWFSNVDFEKYINCGVKVRE
jgi:hypothetical protein